MPGRVAARSSRSAPTTNARTLTRNASPAMSIPDEGESTSLRVQICATFAEAQRSTTGSRKLVVGLRKVQEACCYEPAKPRKVAAQEEFGEDDFNAEVMRCVVRVIPVKKSEPAGDRLVRFLGLFLKHATDRDNAIYQEQDPSGSQDFPETPSSRLSTHVISLLIPLLPAKDKAIRFRSTQIIAHLINTLDSVDDELFHPIRLGLLKRLRDKESTVRAQAVYGLGRLASELDTDQVDDYYDSDHDGVAGNVLGKLLDVLQNDPSADVRRSLLLNLPFTPTTLPFLLERARDSDSSIRRALYSRLLPALADFRHLSLTHREKLLRWGLRDRDDNVKKAAARLFRERWIEDCARSRKSDDQVASLKPNHVSEPTSAALLELLERIDVVNAGVDGGIALDAMKEFWDGRPDYRDHITFDEQFWNDLTPESTFIARTFNDYCRDNGSSNLEEKMPEVTRFAFLVQQNINGLVETVRKSALQEDSEEDSVHQEFIVEQLLYVALTLDYSDEVGRRTMFSLMREALALVELPEEPTKLVVDVLRTTCGNNSAAEREFSGVVLEAIAEVHDTIMGDEIKSEPEGDDSFHSARSEISDDTTPRKANGDAENMDEEKAIREIMVNMKCLHIAQCMLQNIACDLEQNAHLVTMLNNLVIPAVRSQEAPIRERGLLCLGLCCLLDKNLAEENLTLFFHCFTKGHEALQNIAIQIIGDILSAHPCLLVAPTRQALEGKELAEGQEHPLHKPIYKLFSKGLKSPSAHIQTTTCTALCKLMLSSPSAVSSGRSSILNSDELLRLLVVAYFDPGTASNSALRQALSYFLPVYCHSRKENMQRMGRIALNVLQWCISVKEEMDVDVEEDTSGELVGLTVVIAHLVDWTDGKKLAAAMHGIGGQAEDGFADVHVDICGEILEKILGVCSKDERKLYVSMVGKLSFTAISHVEKLQTIADLLREALEDKVASDATTRNTLIKVQNNVDKALSDGRGTSRARSLAPSVIDDAEGATTVNYDEDDGESDMGDNESVLATPAANPRKDKQKVGRKAAKAESAINGAELSSETVLATPAPSPWKRSQARHGASKTKLTAEPVSELTEYDDVSTIAGDFETMKLKEESDDDERTPQPARRTRSKRTGKSSIMAAVQTVPGADISGNLKMTTTDELKVVDELPGEDTAIVESMAHVPQPIGQVDAPKRRGRPPKASSAETQPRKSVRSGRKKATSTVEEEGSDEE